MSINIMCGVVDILISLPYCLFISIITIGTPLTILDPSNDPISRTGDLTRVLAMASLREYMIKKP